MQFKQSSTPKRAPWLLAVAAFWVLILFLKSIEPRPAITTQPPVAQASGAVVTTTAAVTTTARLTPSVVANISPTTPPTLTATASVTTAGVAAALGGDAATGKTLYATTCAACHGPEGKGVKGLGKDMTASPFIASLSDPDLLAFIKRGRDTGDPLNTTGVMMPPKGGNPTLDDAKLTDIIAFLRSIQQ